jgi:hypothetical protein
MCEGVRVEFDVERSRGLKKNFKIKRFSWIQVSSLSLPSVPKKDDGKGQ